MQGEGGIKAGVDNGINNAGNSATDERKLAEKAFVKTETSHLFGQSRVPMLMPGKKRVILMARIYGICSFVLRTFCTRPLEHQQTKGYINADNDKCTGPGQPVAAHLK